LKVLDLRRAALYLIGPIGACLNGCHPHTLTRESHIDVQFSLKELPHKHNLTAIDFVAYCVACKRSIQPGSHSRREVANLVRVWEQHHCRARMPNKGFSCCSERFHGVFGKSIVFNRVGELQFLTGKFTGKPFNSAADHGC
jgi:hypothetical protein